MTSIGPWLTHFEAQLSSSNLVSLQQDGQLDTKSTITTQTKPSRTQERHGISNLHLEELSLHHYTTSEVLWSQAYQDLKRDIPDIIADYELYLSPDESNFNAGDRMKIIVNQIYSKRKSDELVLKLAGKSFKVREIGEKIISFIWESKETITAIASVEPHAALAWSGIAQVFPVRPCSFPSISIPLYEKVSLAIPQDNELSPHIV